MNKIQKREIWIDNIKIFACFLVLLGHFLMSMEKLYYPDNEIYEWFIRTLYTFHVPLFFICSGYLFQKYSKVENFGQWKNNIIKKLIALGIPYLFFSSASWTLKKVFSGEVNNQVGSLKEVLFIKPDAPYWYLYALLFLFLVTPTFQNKKMAKVGLFIALGLKIIFLFNNFINYFPYGIQKIFDNEIWFVIGMCICKFNIVNIIQQRKKVYLLASILTGSLFILMSINLQYIKWGIADFILGLLACFSVITGFMICSKKLPLIKYTMPIYLMHTMAAAGVRSMLFKIGIKQAFLLIPIGLLSSILLPIFATKIMNKIWKLDFLIYPTKYCKNCFIKEKK